MKLMAIDGNSLVNRAFYGVRPLSTKEGIPTNALYGFLNMYFKIFGELAPDRVCVCFDLKAKTFRHKMYDGYKAQRKPMPEDLAAQIPLVKQVLDLMGIPRLELEGYEADDLLGTLAARSPQDGCVIVTGDRDSLQFIAQGAKVALVTTRMGQTTTEVYDEALFEEKYSGLSADKIVDLKALMGDKSDNIPGVPGIGEKGAMDLLLRFGSLGGIYENLETGTFTPSVRKKLTEGRDLAFLSYDLAKGVTDVPIDVQPEDLTLRPRDDSGLYEFLDRMELRSIIKRLDLTPGMDHPEEGAAAFEEQTAEEISDAGRLESILMSGDICCAFDHDMTKGAFAAGDGVYTASEQSVGAEGFRGAVEKLLARGRYIAHDAKPLALYMYSHGVRPGVPVFDTAIAAYLMSPTSNDFSLDTCAMAALGASVSAEKQEEQLSLDAVPQKDSGLSRRAQIIRALWKHYAAQLEENRMTGLMEEIELPLIRVLAGMQHEGMQLDSARLEAFGRSISGEISQLEEQIYSIAGRTFNISSPKQLGQVLFEDLGLKAGKKTKTGYSTDADTLEKLRGQHEIIGLILEYRKVTKLRSTYVEGLLKVVGKDGRIHSSFNQTVTATGRLSSTDPNMQNIPVRQELGSEIRRCFVPREGWVFVDADYSQIELRVLAHIAGDERMIQAFNNNEDIHAVTASQVFGVPLDQVSHEMRSRAKAVNFGIVYGISAFSLSEDIGVYPKQAQQYMDAYLEKYHGVREYMAGIKEKAKEDGYVTSSFGRRRWIPELKAANFNVRAFGERVALNTPIQGTAADIIKLAMIHVADALEDEKLRSRLVLQVHDELILECPAEEADRASEILSREMENAASLSVKLRVDVSRGENWYDAKS